MTPRLRKLALTAHVTMSVGWIGAVGGFLALAIVGLTRQDAEIVRAAYLAMDVIAWYVIIPLAIAALLTGLISSLGTHWGLIKHYWVLTKLLLTVVATVVLLLKLEPIGHVARAATEATFLESTLRQTRNSLLAHAGGGLLVLLANVVLGMYKPWGLTRYGRRKDIRGSRTAKATASSGQETGPRWRLYVIVGLVGLLLLFIVLHLVNGIPRH